MPSTVKVTVFQAQNLPIMDKKRRTTDAYVEIEVPGPDDTMMSRETEVVQGSLNPVWNEKFKFEVVDDSTLQDQTIQVILYDDNKMQQDKTIGSIRIDLNCLLNQGSTMLAKQQRQKQVCVCFDRTSPTQGPCICCTALLEFWCPCTVHTRCDLLLV